ncbi:class I SAM-dependent methyltransferase [Alkalicoccus urumqiensis]|uniref:SAM-dependent methyltransferase n=1 Tax=Alkalicoccus urumqiensis TaxID=1548213 RepID=A0A2P6MJF8_ALKUR|nr:class I SAM-dependent methyltransferase [Alkalicoccus urumqiensis]PRO66418.1 SAM-dependent methyltransferase [Alkalicoccus urumqiensis]
MKNDDTNESIRRWNTFAEAYAAAHHEEGDLHKEVLLNPVLHRFLGDADGKDILDAGCGEGYFSRQLAAAGAVVTAADASSRMLAIAGERTDPAAPIHYIQENAETLASLNSRTFDAVISNMVMQDLGDIEEAFGAVHRVLKNGGAFVFSILHPCFISPGGGWVKNDAGEKLYWKTDRYFEEGVYEQPFGTEENMLLFHRTLTTYIMTLLRAGFTLKAVEEPKPSPAMLEKYPAFQEDLRCADFIVFHAVKEGPASS